jgi:hypothetical protein
MCSFDHRKPPLVGRGWKNGRVTRPIALLAPLVALFVLAGCTVAWAHGSASDDYRTTIVSITPKGLPVDVRIVGGDQIRFENQGDKELVVCGYERDECEEWVRISPEGVFVDENAKSYYANVDETDYGKVPDDAGTKADWTRVRGGPPFYSYHDHRVHWMGTDTPPSVDTSDPTAQKVFDAEVTFRYGDTDGVVKTRLDYVGGKGWLARYGEQLLVWGGVLVMLVVFALDWRKRRAGRREQQAPAEARGDEA